MGNAEHVYDLYRDVRERCNGEIYIGVLGPVRTGKSTFIHRFMDEMVLPYMEDAAAKARAVDELPLSSAGRTITTTEPKFVPNEAAKIQLDGGVSVKVRLIDCVGYLVDGASGHMEGEGERMVKTPWSEEEIPFSRAAEIGTDKVMRDHSTIGLVITTDGTACELPRDAYLDAEKKTIQALKETGKPFLVLVNSRRPYGEEAKNVAARIAKEENVTAMTVNCEQLRRDDILKILENILYEFPVSAMEFYVPRWVEMLSSDNPMKQELQDKVRVAMTRVDKLKDVTGAEVSFDSPYLKKWRIDQMDLSDGVVKISMDPREDYYYEMLTEMVGEPILDTGALMEKLKEYAEMKEQWQKISPALESVRRAGYGVVIPEREEITLEEPTVIRQGNKYGVKIKAVSPSIHMIRANVETEIAPIVGTKEQAEDLIGFINGREQGETMWETNIFGKSVEQLVNEGIQAKITGIGPDSQEKLQDSMQKIVNDSNGGMVCIII